MFATNWLEETKADAARAHVRADRCDPMKQVSSKGGRSREESVTSKERDPKTDRRDALRAFGQIAAPTPSKQEM